MSGFGGFSFGSSAPAANAGSALPTASPVSSGFGFSFGRPETAPSGLSFSTSTSANTTPSSHISSSGFMFGVPSPSSNSSAPQTPGSSVTTPASSATSAAADGGAANTSTTEPDPKDKTADASVDPSATNTKKEPKFVQFSQSTMLRDWNLRLKEVCTRLTGNEGAIPWNTLISSFSIATYANTPVTTESLNVSGSVASSLDGEAKTVKSLVAVIAVVGGQDPTLDSTKPAIKALNEILLKGTLSAGICENTLADSGFLETLVQSSLVHNNAAALSLLRVVSMQLILSGAAVGDLPRIVIKHGSKHGVLSPAAMELLSAMLLANKAGSVNNLMSEHSMTMQRLFACPQEYIPDPVILLIMGSHKLASTVLPPSNNNNKDGKPNEAEVDSNSLAVGDSDSGTAFLQLYDVIFNSNRSTEMSGSVSSSSLSSSSSSSTSNGQAGDPDVLLNFSWQTLQENMRSMQELSPSWREAMIKREMLPSSLEQVNSGMFDDDSGSESKSTSKRSTDGGNNEVLASFVPLSTDQCRVSGKPFEEVLSFRNRNVYVVSDIYLPFVDPTTGQTITKAHWHFSRTGSGGGNNWAVGYANGAFTGGLGIPTTNVASFGLAATNGLVGFNTERDISHLEREFVLTVDVAEKSLTLKSATSHPRTISIEGALPVRLGIIGYSGMEVQFYDGPFPSWAGDSVNSANARIPHSKDFDISQCGARNHTGMMRCGCGHALGSVPFPLDGSYYHLNGSCQWTCCGRDWAETQCSKPEPVSLPLVGNTASAKPVAAKEDDSDANAEFQSYRQLRSEKDVLIFGKLEIKKLCGTMLEYIFQEVGRVLLVHVLHNAVTNGDAIRSAVSRIRHVAASMTSKGFDSSVHGESVQLACKHLSVLLEAGFSRLIWNYFYRPLVYKFAMMARVCVADCAGSSGAAQLSPARALDASSQVSAVKDLFSSVIEEIQEVLAMELALNSLKDQPAVVVDTDAGVALVNCGDHLDVVNEVNMTISDSAIVEGDSSTSANPSASTDTKGSATVGNDGAKSNVTEQSADKDKELKSDPLAILRSLSALAMSTLSEYVDSYLSEQLIANSLLGADGFDNGASSSSKSMQQEAVSYLTARFRAGFPVRSHVVHSLMKLFNCKPIKAPATCAISDTLNRQRRSLALTWVTSIAVWLAKIIREKLETYSKKVSNYDAILNEGLFSLQQDVVVSVNEFFLNVRDCLTLELGFLSLHPEFPATTILSLAVRAVVKDELLSRTECEMLLTIAAEYISTLLTASITSARSGIEQQFGDFVGSVNEVAKLENDLDDAITVTKVLCDSVSISVRDNFEDTFNRLLSARLLSRDAVSFVYEKLVASRLLGRNSESNSSQTKSDGAAENPPTANSTTSSKYNTGTDIIDYVQSLDGAFVAVQKFLLRSLDSRSKNGIDVPSKDIKPMSNAAVNLVFGGSGEALNVAIVGPVGAQLLHLRSDPFSVNKSIKMPSALASIVTHVSSTVLAQSDQMLNYVGNESVALHALVAKRSRGNTDGNSDGDESAAATIERAKDESKNKNDDNNADAVTTPAATPMKLEWLHDASTLVVQLVGFGSGGGNNSSSSSFSSRMNNICNDVATRGGGYEPAFPSSPFKEEPAGLYVLLSMPQYIVLNCLLSRYQPSGVNLSALCEQTGIDAATIWPVVGSLSTPTVQLVTIASGDNPAAARIGLNMGCLETLMTTYTGQTTVDSPLSILPFVTNTVAAPATPSTTPRSCGVNRLDKEQLTKNVFGQSTRNGDNFLEYDYEAAVTQFSGRVENPVVAPAAETSTSIENSSGGSSFGASSTGAVLRAEATKEMSYGHQIELIKSIAGSSSISCPNCGMYGPSQETSMHFCKLCKFCAVCCVRKLQTCSQTQSKVKMPSKHTMVLKPIVKSSGRQSSAFGSQYDRNNKADGLMHGVCTDCKRDKSDFNNCSAYECSKCHRCAVCAAKNPHCVTPRAAATSTTEVASLVDNDAGARRYLLEAHVVEFIMRDLIVWQLFCGSPDSKESGNKTIIKSNDKDADRAKSGETQSPAVFGSISSSSNNWNPNGRRTSANGAAPFITLATKSATSTAANPMPDSASNTRKDNVAENKQPDSELTMFSRNGVKLLLINDFCRIRAKYCSGSSNHCQLELCSDGWSTIHKWKLSIRTDDQSRDAVTVSLHFSSSWYPTLPPLVLLESPTEYRQEFAQQFSAFGAGDAKSRLDNWGVCGESLDNLILDLQKFVSDHQRPLGESQVQQHDAVIGVANACALLRGVACCSRISGLCKLKGAHIVLGLGADSATSVGKSTSSSPTKRGHTADAATAASSSSSAAAAVTVTDSSAASGTVDDDEASSDAGSRYGSDAEKLEGNGSDEDISDDDDDDGDEEDEDDSDDDGSNDDDSSAEDRRERERFQRREQKRTQRRLLKQLQRSMQQEEQRKRTARNRRAHDASSVLKAFNSLIAPQRDIFAGMYEGLLLGLSKSLQLVLFTLRTSIPALATQQQLHALYSVLCDSTLLPAMRMSLGIVRFLVEWSAQEYGGDDVGLGPHSVNVGAQLLFVDSVVIIELLELLSSVPELTHIDNRRLALIQDNSSNATTNSNDVALSSSTATAQKSSAVRASKSPKPPLKAPKSPKAKASVSTPLSPSIRAAPNDGVGNASDGSSLTIADIAADLEKTVSLLFSSVTSGNNIQGNEAASRGVEYARSVIASIRQL
jgi:hypothetical protein